MGKGRVVIIASIPIAIIMVYFIILPLAFPQSGLPIISDPSYPLTHTTVGSITATTYSQITIAGTTTVYMNESGVAYFSNYPMMIVGQLYHVVLSPNCYPSCLSPSFIVVYLSLSNGQIYRLVGHNGNFTYSFKDGSMATITGFPAYPSAFSMPANYSPQMGFSFSADMYPVQIVIQSIQ